MNTIVNQDEGRPGLSPAAALLLAVAIPLLIWLALPIAHPILPTGLFLALHGLEEIFSVVVSLLVFFTAYATRASQLSRRAIWFSAAFLTVALLDLLHTLSYQGMPDFITPNSAHKAIVFWLGARYAAAAGLLAYAVLPAAKVAGRRTRLAAVATALLFTALVSWAELAGLDWMPVFFIDGQGLTPIKIVLEWLVLALYLVAMVMVWFRRDGSSTTHLIEAALFMGVAELFFTLYAHVHAIGNLLGHIYKVAAYIWLYRAVFVEAVQAPIARLADSEHARAESEEHLRQVIEGAPDVILIVAPDGNIEYANTRTLDVLGYSPAELIGRPVEDLIPEHLRSRHGRMRQGYMGRPQTRPMGVGVHLRALRRDGTEVPVEIGLSSVDTRDGKRVLAFLRDVTERVRQEELMRYNATHDELTNLPNRTLLNSRLDDALAHSRHEGTGGVLMLLDPDRFKQVNDTLGHEHGDWLLVSMVERFMTCLSKDAFLARFSGAEFAILIEGADAAAAQTVVNQVLATLSRPFSLNGQPLHQTVSVGIVLYPDNGNTVTALLRNADLALNQAKDAGRNGFRFYSQEMSEATSRRLLLRAKLYQALEHGEFSLEYQPKVSLEDGRITGWEALVRWNSPTEGRVSPAEFIPVTEEYGLIVQLGEWVLDSACRQFSAWIAAGLEPGILAVNLSARQLRDPGLPDSVARILADNKLPAERLELEITETAIMEESALAARALTQLHALGVKLAVDDFGTGYSSLAYLKTFPLDKLKIDRSFVRDLGHDPNDAAIARTIVVLAHTLGLSVIAEGVETETQLAYLKWNRCNEIQGYLFSRPVPPKACEALLRENRRLAVEGLPQPIN